MRPGTLDRTPPPFFRQGPTALTKLLLCTALSVLCMVADLRWQVMEPVRAAAATVLLPVQQVVGAPVQALSALAGYFRGLGEARADADAAHAQLTAQALTLARATELQAENERLRALLALGPALTVASQAAEVLHESADLFSRKVVINRGQTQGVLPGSPVIDERGVLGQVTRVLPLTSEVTLLTDRDAAIPVINTRTQQRGAAFGGVQGANGAGMELRFAASNADIQVGDQLVTSGLDGVYPPGLNVAQVALVRPQGNGSFAQVLLTPAGAEGFHHVLVLQPLRQAMSKDQAAEVEQHTAQAAAVSRPASKRVGGRP
jgi:rod shape-determining protein MreC